MNKTLNLSDALYDYILDHSVDDDNIAIALREQTQQLHGGHMQIAPDQGQAMQVFLKMLNAKKVLELGTFTGYSALCMARAIPEDGCVITCDTDPKTTNMAQHFWSQAGISHKIDLRLAPALDTLDDLLSDPAMLNSFDFIFIDADKINYPAYYEAALKLLRTGGVVALDNILWSGKVIENIPEDKRNEMFRELNSKIKSDNRVFKCILPIGDGLTMAIKK